MSEGTLMLSPGKKVDILDEMSSTTVLPEVTPLLKSRTATSITIAWDSTADVAAQLMSLKNIAGKRAYPRLITIPFEWSQMSRRLICLT